MSCHRAHSSKHDVMIISLLYIRFRKYIIKNYGFHDEHILQDTCYDKICEHED